MKLPLPPLLRKRSRTGVAYKRVRGLLPLLALIPATPAVAGEVALTFDDLPGLTIRHDQAYVDAFNRRLVARLARHHIPAIGFVNADKIDTFERSRQIANLRLWLRSGLELGNHSFSHPAASKIGAQAYIADIAHNDTALAPLGIHMRWFRHPYLDTGSPIAARREIENWLAAHGYRIAPVTLDADDWEFAEPYDDAITRHDRRAQRRIRAEYLAYTALRIGWSQASARALFGRDISHVMLLHASRLEADTLPRLLALLARAGLRPVSLDRAMRDPAYQTADDYAGRDGIGWLERWALTLGKALPETGDQDPPEDIQQAYDHVDNDRR